jgi:hypothetical protein
MSVSRQARKKEKERGREREGEGEREREFYTPFHSYFSSVTVTFKQLTPQYVDCETNKHLFQVVTLSFDEITRAARARRILQHFQLKLCPNEKDAQAISSISYYVVINLQSCIINTTTKRRVKRCSTYVT